MIRINLLRSTGLNASAMVSTSSGGEVTAESQQKVAGAKIFVILLFPLLLYAYEYSNLSSLAKQSGKIQADADTIEKKRAAYGDTGPKVEKNTKLKTKIDSQMGVIRGLTKNRLREVKALDSLQEITPPQVWFEEIGMEDGLVRAKGYSLTDEGLTDLFTKLQNSAIFSRFEPRSQTPKTAPNGSRTVAFEIEFRIGRQDQP